MKSYTDIIQSKTLSKILPLESADMCYMYLGTEDKEYEDIPICAPAMEGDLCAWSLAALLGVLPSATLDSSNDHYYRLHCMERFTEWYDNAIDVCYKMILKLNELNLL